MNLFFSFLSGGIMMGCWVSGLFFFRFWNKTQDRLFLFFGFAFWIMALERIVLTALREGSNEGHFSIYLLRLSAFILVLISIIDKNRIEKQG